jgi:hypothetical protein
LDIVLDATDVATDEPDRWTEQLRAIVADFDQVNSPGWERYFCAFPTPSGKLVDAEFIVGTGF